MILVDLGSAVFTRRLGQMSRMTHRTSAPIPVRIADPAMTVIGARSHQPSGKSPLQRG